MSLPIVEMNIETHYRIGLPKPILSRVSWRIEAGQHWAIVGENGSGKSTLLSILSGALWPSRGTVRVFGEEYGRTDKRILKKRIGVVSSVLFGSFPEHDSALEVAASGLDARIGRWGALSDEEARRGLHALARVFADGYAKKPYGVLSQGERQRVMIARALVNEPSLLILDEPSSGLDPVARERFLADLQALADSNEGPVQVHVTHHLEEIPSFVTHALLLKEGSVLTQAPIDAVLTSEWLTQAFGAPCRVSKYGHLGSRFRLEVGPIVAKD